MSEREEKFERMMQAVLDSYNSVVEKMDKLKQEGKTNTVTYSIMWFVFIIKEQT